MISRCPSCAAQVDDEAPRCPSCHWDFAARRRIPPGEAAPAPEPAKPAPPAAKAAPPLELQHFADILEDAPPMPVPPVRKAEPPKAASKPAPAKKAEPRPPAKKAEPARPAKRPQPPEPAPRPAGGAPAPKTRVSARLVWMAAAIVALIGLGANVWRLIPAAQEEPTLPLPKTVISFAKHDEP